MVEITPCPYCDSAYVARDYELVDGRSQPGCLTCKATCPLDEWTAQVAARKHNSDVGI
jgi:hypothetical protein